MYVYYTPMTSPTYYHRHQCDLILLLPTTWRKNRSENGCKMCVCEFVLGNIERKSILFTKYESKNGYRG